MKPYKSSSEKENCSPQSSNCVIWQGPDLSCISLCKGDSISDVTYKLAVELCAIKDATNMGSVDFSCLLNDCANTNDPEVTVAGIIQLIIDNVCCEVTQLQNSTSALFARTSNLYEEPELVLPSCLQYVDPTTGLPVTTLILSDYAVHTATAFCDLRNTVLNQGNQILDLDVRVTALENDPGYVPPLVTPNCTYGTVVAGVPADMNIVLDNLDERVCNLVTAIGSTTDITNAAASECTLLGAQTALSQVGTMASIPGWNNVVSNMAQSMQNLWLTVCDIRAVIYDLKACCATADCSAFFLVYSANADIARANVTLLFNSGTVIPAGFANCPLLSTLSITDGIGNTYTDTLDLVALSTNPGGITVDVSTASLDPAMPYTVTVTGCIVKDGNTCTKVVNNIVPPPTTTTTTTSTTTSTTSTTSTTTTTTVACTCYSWTVSPNATDLSNAAGNTNTFLNGKIFVDYIACNATSVTTVPYSTAVVDQTLGCSCLIPYAYYFNANVAIACTAGTVVLDGNCVLP
jgi:hypothetical protein